MENQNSPTRIIISYGIILGIVSILINVINYSFGNIYDPHWIYTLVGMLVFVLAIVYGIKSFKTTNNGLLKLTEALKIAVGIALIAGIIGALYQYIFSHYIEPDFVEKQMLVIQDKMLEKFPDMDEDMLEKQMEMSKKFNTPLITTAMAVAGSMIMGLIVGLVAGLIMKKEETTF